MSDTTFLISMGWFGDTMIIKSKTVQDDQLAETIFAYLKQAEVETIMLSKKKRKPELMQWLNANFAKDPSTKTEN